VGAVLVAGVLASGTMGSGGVGGDPAADSLLAQVPVPAGAVRSVAEPAASDGRLAAALGIGAHGPAATASGWWVVPDADPRAVLDEITTAAEHDIGAEADSVGAVWGSEPKVSTALLDGPGASRILMAATGLPDGSVALRVDATTFQNAKGECGWTCYAPLTG
jgi:hypothetical protein